MREVLSRINASFKKATKGEEALSCVVWYWGVPAYLSAFFIVNKLILSINSAVFDFLMSLLMVVYFCWHAVALRKCTPKKPKLTPEEQKKLKEERRHNLGKSVARKLLLQEPITKANPGFTALMIDLLCITHFLSYLIKG